MELWLSIIFRVFLDAAAAAAAAAAATKKQLWIISFLNGLARLSQHFWNGPKIRSNNNMFMWVVMVPMNGHYIPSNDQISVLNKRSKPPR